MLPLALLSLAVAAPFAFPAFPANEDFTTVAAWAARRTDIPAGDLVDVRDGLAFVVLPAVAATGPRAIRIEALDAQAWRRIGGRSAELHAVLDCDPPGLSMGSVDVYAASNRLGEVRRGLAPSPLKLSPGTAELVAAALCTPGMRARPAAVARLDQPETRPDPVGLASTPAPTIVLEPGRSAAPGKPLRARQRAQPPPPPPGGIVAVQVGAFSTFAAAMDALGELETGRYEVERRVELAKQGDKVIYRALLTGFASPQAAGDFCRALATRRHGCAVRGLR